MLFPSFTYEVNSIPSEHFFIFPRQNCREKYLIRASSLTVDCWGFWRSLLEIPSHWVRQIPLPPPPVNILIVSGCLGAGYFNYCDIDPNFAKNDHKMTSFTFIFHEKVVLFQNIVGAECIVCTHWLNTGCFWKYWHIYFASCSGVYYSTSIIGG